MAVGGALTNIVSYLQLSRLRHYRDLGKAGLGKITQHIYAIFIMKNKLVSPNDQCLCSPCIASRDYIRRGSDDIVRRK